MWWSGDNLSFYHFWKVEELFLCQVNIFIISTETSSFHTIVSIIYIKFSLFLDFKPKLLLLTSKCDYKLTIHSKIWIINNIMLRHLFKTTNPPIILEEGPQHKNSATTNGLNVEACPIILGRATLSSLSSAFVCSNRAVIGQYSFNILEYVWLIVLKPMCNIYTDE